MIAQGLRDSLVSWNLSEDRHICMTRDSGINIMKAMSVNEWPNLQCFGHKLHNAIGKYNVMALQNCNYYSELCIKNKVTDLTTLMKQAKINILN